MTAFIIILASLALLILMIILLIIVPSPSVQKCALEEKEVLITGEQTCRLEGNWMRRSKSGLWELYVKGSPYERGLATGKLTRELMKRQESLFVEQITRLIPSKIYLSFLKVLVALMNRRLYKHIGPEYCSEIYGISRSAPKEFSFVGPAYLRMLNYHAAHDIGHTLQDMHLVKCTAFSVWGDKSVNGEIFTARNFDFYVGDEFSKEKIICFCEPESGHRFATITWGGMIGSVSGMNEHGLAVTVNGAKAEFPTGSATPISILVREILQYARNIDEAWQITIKRKIFVSESLMISSAEDGKSVLFEKSRLRTVRYESGTHQLICTNHFQSPELAAHPSNQKYMRESPSPYRYRRVEELLSQQDRCGAGELADILRNKLGLEDRNIGMGNEKAVDQMLAHHSVIFNPCSRKFWISKGPYPEGAYQCYDLRKVFASGSNADEKQEITEASLEIPDDPILSSVEWNNWTLYKKYVGRYTDKSVPDPDPETDDAAFIASNPELFTVYSVLGDHYLGKGDVQRAAEYYRTGLSKDIPNLNEKKQMEKRLLKAEKKKAQSGNSQPKHGSHA